ncbi:hypothetical protein ANTRET_LOCUS4508 [Anthophora retusa]
MNCGWRKLPHSSRAALHRSRASWRVLSNWFTCRAGDKGIVYEEGTQMGDASSGTSGSTLPKTTERRRTRSQVFDESFSRFREPTPTESKPATQCNNRSLVYEAF